MNKQFAPFGRLLSRFWSPSFSFVDKWMAKPVFSPRLTIGRRKWKETFFKLLLTGHFRFQRFSFLFSPSPHSSPSLYLHLRSRDLAKTTFWRLKMVSRLPCVVVFSQSVYVHRFILFAFHFGRVGQKRQFPNALALEIIQSIENRG